MTESTITAAPPLATDTTARDRAVHRVVALSLALAAGAITLVVTSPLLGATARQGPWWLAILIAFGYWVAERSVFHVEYRREALTFSMSEVPTAFALVFLDPITAIVVRVVGAMAAIVPGHRPPPFKLLFNTSLFSFDTALGFALLAGVAGGTPSDGRLLAAVVVATALAHRVGSLAVSAAISCFEGGFVNRVLDDARLGPAMGLIAATTAGVSVAPALIGLHLVVLALVPIAAIWFVLLQHGRLSQRHRDLEGLHDFAGSIVSSLRFDEVAASALDSALGLVRAERGILQIYAPDGGVAHEEVVGRRMTAPVGPDDPVWAGVLGRREATGYAVRDGEIAALDRRSPAPHIAVPVVDDGGLLGLLLMGDRRGVTDSFEIDDVRRASRLGERLAAHLRNASLHADIEYTALHDELTGDHNRRAFDEIVTADLADRTATRAAGEAAVIMLDLDRFKEVNDTFGHHTGDRLLIEFAARVRGLLAPDDVFARFGGDEFALYVRRDDRRAVLDLADRIVTRAHEAIALGGYDIVVAVSAGVATVSADDTDSAGVLRRADIAMYTAKSSHAGYEIYRAEIDRRTPERLAILGDLRDAIDGSGIAVHYQPKIDIATGSVIGAEALVRWNHPVRGWVAPDEFIPVAEESGLIRQVTERVLADAIKTAARWRADGFELGVSVNLSALDLVDEELPARLDRHLRRYALPVHALTLEITESSLMADTPRTMATIDRLDEIGVRISLDDFGTGYSSLSYLRRLPVSELKIDRGFVANLLLDAQDEVIVRSTIDLGHNLGLRVVAEGIESHPMVERLREMGCDLGQGYAISRALPADLFTRWLTTTEYSVPRRSQRALSVVAGSTVSRLA